MTETCTCPRCGQPHYLGFGPDTVAEKDAEIDRLMTDNAQLKNALNWWQQRAACEAALKDAKP
ncbi:MAG: hypothetical protein ABWY64_25755 [Tardiphaga sp.]|jgi:hypothetical protein